ncbi:hypothetical protein TWF128_009236 [Orbilia oligospora]|nr:hypothetical protein TWF128_009236 [Orbilia oligospora]
MPRCVQCTVSKKKCYPENRQWPELCNLCIKSGLPCSPFTSKQEFDNLSVNELAAYQTKSQIRSPKDLIADIDCLFYLRAGVLEWRPFSSGSGTSNDGCHNWEGLRERLLDLIDSVIEEVKFEASGVVRQHLARGRESLIQLILQGQDEDMLHSVEKAVACRLRPAAFHLPYCLGKIPVSSLTKNHARIVALSESILPPLAGVHVNVSRQDILNTKLIPYQEIKHFDDVQMTPLMYALYTRRYSVIYAILTTKNPDWVFQTSTTALSDIAILPHRTERLLGPVHVAAWTYGPCIARRDSHTYFDMTEIFSKLCRDANHLASAIEIAISLGTHGIGRQQSGLSRGPPSKKTLENAQRDVASLTQPLRAGEIIGRSGDAGKEPDISDRELNDKRIGYESQTELTSTEDNRNRSSPNTKASQQKRNETQDEKDGYGSALGGKLSVNRQHKPMGDFDILNELKASNDRQIRSSIESNLTQPKIRTPSWGAQQRQWKFSGGKLSYGSGIMSLASKAYTASSGLSVISFGGMPFTQPRGRGLNFEKSALEEEPEFMDIDGLPTSPP